MSQVDNHPDFDHETNMLQSIVKYIKKQIRLKTSSPEDFDRKRELRARHDTFQEEIEIYKDAIRDQPYFARLDFKNLETGDLERYYISKHPLGMAAETDIGAPASIISWENHMAGVFYDDRVEFHLNTVDEPTHGQVFLRRNLDIKFLELLNISDKLNRYKQKEREVILDETVIDPDEYLRRILETDFQRG